MIPSKVFQGLSKKKYKKKQSMVSLTPVVDRIYLPSGARVGVEHYSMIREYKKTFTL